MSRKAFARSVVAVFGTALMVVGMTTAAEAAPSAKCVVKPQLPVGDGNYIYSTTVMSCPGGVGLVASVANTIAQEKVLLVWYNRGTQAWHTSVITSNFVTQSYYCNGNGTDSYRNRGQGIDNFDRTTTVYTGGTSLTC